MNNSNKRYLKKIDNKYQFDLVYFLKNQHKIAKKYEKNDCTDIKIIGSSKFIEIYDKYILHTIEEIIESKEEIYINDDKLLQELVDILMYTGSANYLIQNSCNIEPLPILFFPIIKQEKEYKYLHNGLFDCVNNLINQRRLFPERKWHRKYKIFTMEENEERIIKMYNLNIELIKSILLLILTLTNDIDLINVIIKAKQEYIFYLN